MLKLLSVVLMATFITSAYAKNTVVLLKTSMGEIEIELDETKAPATTANFLKYVDAKFYDGTIFHRVINNFMIQGGEMTADLKEKKTREPIKNEATNGLRNEPGTVAMARTSAPHSATAQFFINVGDNSFLNHTAPNDQGFGYAVFGKVVKGMDIVNRIKLVKTGSLGGHQDVPMDTVTIKSVSRKK